MSQPNTALMPPPLEEVVREKKKIRPIRGWVVDCVKETSDTWTLHLFVGDENRHYQAGQFVSIGPHQFAELSEQVAFLEHAKGKKEQIRAYSMSSAPFEPYVSITIKPERFHPHEGKYPPLLSPLLASPYLKGREITFLGYTGAYVLPAHHGESIDHVLHFVSGSGIVPNFALLKDELILCKNERVKHTLLYVNKTYEDIIFQRPLQDLAKTYSHRFQIMHFLTRTENPSQYGPNYMAGRPTFEHVRSLVTAPRRTLVYACGAAITKWQRQIAEESGTILVPRFMESVHDMVQRLEIPKANFKREVYG